MEMKIVGIVGSPRGMKGATGKLLDAVLASAEENGAVAETFALTGGTVLPCKACDVCHVKGVCPIDDDFETIRRKIMESDALVLASPNYIFHVSAQLKAFLDRCGSVLHCIGFEGKYGASIVTSGGGDEEPIADYMNHFMVNTGIVPVGSVWATMGTFQGPGFPQEVLSKAWELGRILVECWRNKTTSPEVETQQAAFKRRMKYLMEYRKEEWPFEYEHWKSKNWL